MRIPVQQAPLSEPTAISTCLPEVAMNVLVSPSGASVEALPRTRERELARPLPVPRISVVVPTRARPEALRCCIAALLEQQVEDRAAYEIVVVDDGHAEETRLAVEAMKPADGVPALRYFRPRRGHGAAVARNVGWREAYGDLVAFVDDHSIPQADWLARGEAALTSELVAVAGQLRDASGAVPGRAPLGLPTSNAFVRRSALQRIGGFDENFERPSGDDPDLLLRLQRDAGPVGHCDEAVVQRADFPGCLRRQRDAYFDALLYKKHPRFFREQAAETAPWEHYLIVGLALGAPGFMIAGVTGSAVVSLLIAWALVLRLAIRRLRQPVRDSAGYLGTLATSALIPFLSVYWRVSGALRFRVWFF